ncbi:MAG: substrate-binding domain-containing protein [Candidatus Eremiobacteraeota bacterium]|nr:substrate-binding domain-containing protein [Candidatus Eremiobacteraeota bacterium]
MRKHVQGLIAAAVPLIFLTACGGGNTPSPLVPSQTAANQASDNGGTVLQPQDLGPASLHAAGATFPAEVYNLASQPAGVATGAQALPGAGSLFASYGGTGHIYYCLTGSGFGKKMFIGDNIPGVTAPCAALGATPTGAGGRTDPLDFVGSDQALKSTEYADFKTNRLAAHGQPFEFPSVGGPIVFGYKQTDLPGLGAARLRLSRWTYCAIANGTVRNWDDAAITKDNGVSVTGGKSLAITFFYRSDSSGTSFLFQNHLNSVCGSAWPAPYNAAPYQSAGRNAQWGRGTNTTWLGPTTTGFQGASGNPGVLNGIQKTLGATGYVEGAYAARSARPVVSQAVLRNNAGDFIDPTVPADVAAALANVTSLNITFGGASDGINLGTVGDTRTDCILYVDPSHFSNPSAATAYPIVGISYLMFNGAHNTHLADVKRLVNFIVSPTGNSITSKFEYSPLSSSIQSVTRAAVNGTGSYSFKPCVQ